MNEVAPPPLTVPNSTGVSIAGISPILSKGSYAKGIFCCLAATVSFGLMFPVMASVLKRIDPFTFASVRYLIAADRAVLSQYALSRGISAERLRIPDDGQILEFGLQMAPNR